MAQRGLLTDPTMVPLTFVEYHAFCQQDFDRIEEHQPRYHKESCAHTVRLAVIDGILELVRASPSTAKSWSCG